VEDRLKTLRLHFYLASEHKRNRDRVNIFRSRKFDDLNAINANKTTSDIQLLVIPYVGQEALTPWNNSEPAGFTSDIVILTNVMPS